MKLTLVLAVILCGAIVAADERISTITKKRSLQQASNKPTRPPTKKPTKVSTANHPTRPPTTPPTKVPRDGSGAIAAPTKHPTTPSPSTRPPTYHYTRPKATSSPSSTSAARSGSAQLAGAANQHSTRAPSRERASVPPSTKKPASTPTTHPTSASGRNPHWWRTYRAKYGQRWKKCAYLKQRTATQGGRCRTLTTGPYFCARGSQYACGQDGVWEYEYPTERCNCSDGTFDCSPIELLPADVDCSAVSQ